MDINTLAVSDQPETLKLLHPITNDPLKHEGKDMSVAAFGADSLKYRQAFREVQSEKIDDAIEASIAVYARLVQEVHIYEGGSWVKDTKKAPDLLRKYPWIRDQLDKFIHGRRNFMTGLSKKS